MTSGPRAVTDLGRLGMVSNTNSQRLPGRIARCGRWARRKRARSGIASAREAGFTLVEVIAALAILSASLSVLLGMISAGLLRTSSAEKMVEAGSLTQSLLAEVGADYPVMAGERVGEFANGYHWHLKMQPVGGGREDGPVGLYQVSADVEWGEGTEKRFFRLNTLRVGPRVSQK